MFDLKEIFSKFKTNGDFVRSEELSSGHINDTFYIETTRKPGYVLQRVNQFVFQHPARVIENKVRVSEYLTKKLSYFPKEEMQRRVLTFVQSNSGKNYYQDLAGNFWNLMIYIEDCLSFEKVPNRQTAFEAGKIYSEFLYLTGDFDSGELFEILPNFHSMSFRFKQFDEALTSALASRKSDTKELISFAEGQRIEMQKIENLIAKNKIPFRLTHNDTKISNVLFSLDEEAICVVDTDTVMTGVVHYDFGDAVRTICNTAREDEKDLLGVEFNFDFFEAFVKGFFSTPLKNELSRIEINNLVFSAKLMTFIMGLRMLTDYLNNDVYYKTEYETHNLDRAKNQFKLLDEMDKNSERMENVVQLLSKRE
jgi:hypothetical protein